MAEPDEYDDEDGGTVEEQLLRHARRQTNALERILLVLEVMLGVGVIAAVLWLIAVLGR